MFYRRKIILALLDQFGGTLSKTDFQKYLFLFTQVQNKKNFDFVPYKFGCFSFQAQQDISTMIKYGQIEETNLGWKKNEKKRYIAEIKMNDRISLVKFHHNIKHLKNKELIKYVYERYPYYAINSEIAKDILDNKALTLVQNSKPRNDITALFTIGYEGKSVEEYANILIDNDIKILVDVRKNSKSMKYGFSKNQLLNVMENIGIKYYHIPELGIVSDKRKNLNDFNDYQKLFSEYENDVLPYQSESIKKIDKLMFREKRVALTCFEADHNFCHRSKVADAVLLIQKEKYNVTHL